MTKEELNYSIQIALEKEFERNNSLKRLEELWETAKQLGMEETAAEMEFELKNVLK